MPLSCQKRKNSLKRRNFLSKESPILDIHQYRLKMKWLDNGRLSAIEPYFTNDFGWLGVLSLSHYFLAVKRFFL
jgi:hypothetical protein